MRETAEVLKPKAFFLFKKLYQRTVLGQKKIFDKFSSTLSLILTLLIPFNSQFDSISDFLSISHHCMKFNEEFLTFNCSLYLRPSFETCNDFVHCPMCSKYQRLFPLSLVSIISDLVAEDIV